MFDINRHRPRLKHWWRNGTCLVFGPPAAIDVNAPIVLWSGPVINVFGFIDRLGDAMRGWLLFAASYCRFIVYLVPSLEEVPSPCGSRSCDKRMASVPLHDNNWSALAFVGPDKASGRVFFSLSEDCLVSGRSSYESCLDPLIGMSMLLFLLLCCCHHFFSSFVNYDSSF